MSSSPQPGDVYEDPSGLIVVVLEMFSRSAQWSDTWWTCAALCDMHPKMSIPVGYVSEYPLLYNGAWVRLAP